MGTSAIIFLMWNDVPSMSFNKISFVLLQFSTGGQNISWKCWGYRLMDSETWRRGLSLTGQCDSTFHCWMIINICLTFFFRWVASRSTLKLQISPEMIRYTATAAVPNLTLQLWVLSVFSGLAAVLNVSHDTFVFCQDCVMKQHPDVLLLLLKRFELDQSFMKYTKNNSNIDIPHSLQTPTTVHFSVEQFFCDNAFFILSPKVTLACSSESDLWAVCSRGAFGRPHERSLHCNHKGWWGLVPLWW